ncbi:Signal transduction histidine-protein kinase BaeS [subsurface metagenome]
MRSLTWKLGGALLLIVFVSVGLMAYLTNLSTTREFQQYVSRGNMMYTQSLANSLGDLYAEEQGWNNIQETLRSLPLSTSARILVTDSSGVIIADTAREWLGKESAEVSLSDGTPITVSGQTVGSLYLLTSGGMVRGHMGGRIPQAIPMVVTSEEDFLERVNDSLWKVGLIAVAVALVIGLILTRQITRPVRALISGARHLTKGELSYRVTVKSRDEIGELADSFNIMASSLEKGEQSRRQLTADIAHELRTPLTVIEGTVDGIIDGVFQPDTEHLRSIKEQTALLTHLISDLRDISLAESGQLKLNLTSTDMVELVRRVVSNYEINAREKNIRIKLEEEPQISEIEADTVRMEQVISNLLVNAIRHTPSNGSISVTIKNDEGGLAISVADTGEGIAPEDLPHVFERFYRSGSSRSRKEGGTGLGLAIVKQMVEAHGGKVWVESKMGTGSIFSILFPFSI